MAGQKTTDPLIRKALKCNLLSEDDASDAVIIDELGICQGSARVDVAVVNEILHGYEIKSDADSLRRLPLQAETYSRVFDRMTLVVGSRHFTQARKIIPCWWGLVKVSKRSGQLVFRAVRRGRQNRTRSARALAELLWRDQALELLEARGASKGVRTKGRNEIWDRVSKTYDLEEIASEVRARLKERAKMRR